MILRTSNHGTESGVIVGDTTLVQHQLTKWLLLPLPPKTGLWMWGQGMLGFVLRSESSQTSCFYLYFFNSFCFFCASEPAERLLPPCRTQWQTTFLCSFPPAVLGSALLTLHMQSIMHMHTHTAALLSIVFKTFL